MTSRQLFGKYVIWGPPGTGKTTTLARQVESLVVDRNIPDVLLCSLTRTAAQELAARNLPIPPWRVGTLHSHAYHALDRPVIAESKIAEFNEATKSQLSAVSGMNSKIDEPDWEPNGEQTQDDADYMAYQLCRARMTPREVWRPQVTAFAERWESWKREMGYMDFTDLIDLAARDVEKAPGEPAVLIADEAQDYSALEHHLLDRWARNAEAVILAGDPWQAIYTWRGADPDGLTPTNLSKDRVKVLGKSHRLPAAVRDYALRWMRQWLSGYVDLQFAPRCEGGQVRASECDSRHPEGLLPQIIEHLDAGDSVMICASCSYQLEPTLAMLRAEGLPFCNPRRVARGDWNPLSGRGVTMRKRALALLRPDPHTHGDDARDWSFRDVRDWATAMDTRGGLSPFLRGAKKSIELRADTNEDAPVDFEALNKWFKPEALSELTTLLVNCMHGLRGVTAADVVDWWQSRLLNRYQGAARYIARVIEKRGGKALKDEPKLYVGTIHSFKGFEADHVFIFPDLSPAGFRQWTNPGKDRDAVTQLFYVAVTRARKSVTICGVRSRFGRPSMAAPLLESMTC